MEILFDTLSSERGVQPVVMAAVRVQQKTGVSVAFLGLSDVIYQILEDLNHPKTEIRVVESSQFVTMDEYAPDACREKQHASINLGMREILSGRSDAIVCPGHTGATVCAARDILGLMPPVKRPGLCQIFPTSHGKHCLILDVGASLSADATDRVLFSEMGRQCCRSLLDRNAPSIALLNIGSEPSKGNLDLIESHEAMKQWVPGFIGNIEGHLIWTGNADVVVTDGITGNIVLKSAEGLLRLLTANETNGSKIINDPRSHFQKEQYGGALLLGVNGVCIITHGHASQREIESAGMLSWNCCKTPVVTDIAHHLQNLSFKV